MFLEAQELVHGQISLMTILLSRDETIKIGEFAD